MAEEIRRRRTHIADYILIGAALCFLISFPMEDFFWGPTYECQRDFDGF